MLVVNISNPRFVDVFIAESAYHTELRWVRGSIGGLHTYGRNDIYSPYSNVHVVLVIVRNIPIFARQGKSLASLEGNVFF